jgi:hypothetical protein
MQNDLDANYLQLDIRILGVNGAGLESGNAFITSGRDIPWLLSSWFSVLPAFLRVRVTVERPDWKSRRVFAISGNQGPPGPPGSSELVLPFSGTNTTNVVALRPSSGTIGQR